MNILKYQVLLLQNDETLNLKKIMLNSPYDYPTKILDFSSPSSPSVGQGLLTSKMSHLDPSAA
jgi:hypothetical protein